MRVGVIGAGNMGRHHIRNYSEMPETELVAFADPNPDVGTLAGQYNAVHYLSHEEMLDGVELDAVSVVVPTHLHYRIAKETISRGIHTLLEKPIASNEQEATELIDLSERAGVVLTVGHIERYNPIVKALKELIISNSLGTISSVTSQRLGGFPKNEPKTDVIMDLAIHDIDIISHLIGHDGEILGVHGSQTFHSSEVDSVEILMRYNGASGIIQANWVTPVKIRKITITGSRGYVEADYISQGIEFYEANVRSGMGTYEEFVKHFGDPEKHVIPVEHVEPLRRELSAFVLAAAGGQPELLVQPRDALAALNIALSAGRRLSAKRVQNV